MVASTTKKPKTERLSTNRDNAHNQTRILHKKVTLPSKLYGATPTPRGARLLEHGDLPLEDSIKLFEEGMLLSTACKEQLNEV